MTDVREKSTTLLTSTLESLLPDGDSSAEHQTSALEAAVFEKHAGETGNEYRNEIRQLSLDLGKNNTELGKRVAKGEIDARSLAKMSSEVGKES